MPDCCIVILGVTGDLSLKKLIPAIHNLTKHKTLNNFSILGVATSDTTAKEILDQARVNIKDLDKKVWQKLEKNFRYISGDFYNEKTYVKIKDNIKKHKNLLFYLATLPSHFEVISSNIQKCSLNKSEDGWTRVVYEKPFGEDLESAKSLNKCVTNVFEEDQIYRIDHYLGKELVQNISVLRFTNTILEPIFNENDIDHVQIILSEDIGVGKRGKFYDRYGALKDVIQNHGLQLLSLIAMEPPTKFKAKHIRNEKAKVLEALRPINDAIYGQYEGYTAEEGVRRGSKTETFAAIKAYIDNLRWKDVPFYIRTGKNLDKKETLIYVQFENSPCILFENCELLPNYLVIMIQPTEGFYITVNAKVPGSSKIKQVKMNYCHNCIFKTNSPEAYENLFENIMNGDQSVFVRNDEIEYSWKALENLISRKNKNIHIYKKGTIPVEADKFIRKDGREWFKS